MSEKVINFDFEGFPEKAMSIKDILVSFGAVYNKETNKWEIEDSDFLLTTPTVYEDDGMGYCVREEYLIDGHMSRDHQNYYFIREKELPHIDIWKEAGIFPGIITFNVDNIEWMPMSADICDGKHVIVCDEFDIDKMKKHEQKHRTFTVEEIKILNQELKNNSKMEE